MLTHVDSPQSRCRFAIAHADVTPPAGIYHRMWGAAKHDRSTGVHRPLRATVTLLAALKGGGRQFIAALDHCTLGRVEMDQLLDAITEGTGAARGEIVVVFSHTHGAGLMGLERAALPGGELIPPYLDQLARTLTGLARTVQEALQPATLVYGRGRCDLAAHRDFWDDKLKVWVCGYNPGQAVDDTVLVARVTGTNHALLATIVNYACHPTTLAWDNTLISPDFPGAMRETVEAATGGAPCLFLQGASGELGPVEGFVGDPAVADRNGRKLGYAALSALESLPPPDARFAYAGPVVSGATLGAWAYRGLPEPTRRSNAVCGIQRDPIVLPLRPGTPAVSEVEEALARWERDDSDQARAMAERQRRLLHRLKQLPPGDSFPLETVVLRLGGAVWVLVQGEFYSVLQTALRSRFPGTPLMIATLASHWGASYLPPRELYGTGIYQESIAIAAAGSLETVIETIAGRIEALLT